jgi:hypothetical protein
VGVSNGASFSAPFPVTITYDSSAIPQGVSAKNLKLFHYWTSDLGRITNQEVVSTGCLFPGKSTIPSNAPCIKVDKLPGSDLAVTLWTFHNGGARSGY